VTLSKEEVEFGALMKISAKHVDYSGYLTARCITDRLTFLWLIIMNTSMAIISFCAFDTQHRVLYISTYRFGKAIHFTPFVLLETVIVRVKFDLSKRLVGERGAHHEARMP